MARTLILFRHAKSSWQEPGLTDLDRRLNARGLAAAGRMGLELCARAWFPRRALVSPARRTRDTWTLADECLPTACETIVLDAIYEAEADVLLDAIRETPADVGDLIVVGHNPGLDDLAALLVAPDSEPGALSALRAKFPTAAIARFEIRTAWSSLGRASARLTDFLTPRGL